MNDIVSSIYISAGRIMGVSHDLTKIYQLMRLLFTMLTFVCQLLKKKYK